MTCLNCCYKTRKGTAVLHKGAARMAGSMEIWHKDDVAEYKVYGRILVGDSENPRFAAEDGDNLMLTQAPDLPTHAHVLNLTNGLKALVSWDVLAHNVRPKD